MKVFVKPTEVGSIVRKPESMISLQATGELVELNSYWSRRIRDKDVIVTDAPIEKKISDKGKE